MSKVLESLHYLCTWKLLFVLAYLQLWQAIKGLSLKIQKNVNKQKIDLTTSLASENSAAYTLISRKYINLFPLCAKKYGQTGQLKYENSGNCSKRMSANRRRQEDSRRL